MKVGAAIWGILVGCLVGIFLSIGMVFAKGRDNGRDPFGWAWIDVVRTLVPLYERQNTFQNADRSARTIGVRCGLLQISDNRRKVYTASVGELPAPINGWVEY